MARTPRALTTWSVIAARLGGERTYWLGTVGRDAAPHVAPVWGVVMDGSWFGYSERGTVKARNIVANPRVVIHLAGGEDVAIVHGTMLDLGRPSACGDVVAAFDAKYTSPDDRAFLPSTDQSFDVLWQLQATSAMLWRLDDYEGSQRRWRAVR